MLNHKNLKNKRNNLEYNFEHLKIELSKRLSNIYQSFNHLRV